MLRRFAAVLGSALLLSAGWLGADGLPLLVAFVPLLALSDTCDDASPRRLRAFGWAALAFVLWNAMTIWWIWFATPVGPFAATLASVFLNLLAFGAFLVVRGRAPKALAYTTFVAAWIATEYWYTVSDFSWPWLVLGNGFSHDVWAVQWYEYTGVFGGSLWVLVCNLLIYEAWRVRRSVRRWMLAAAAVVVPILVSLTLLGCAASGEEERTITVSVVQPNVDCYDKFNGDVRRQERNIIGLLASVPAGTQFVLLPETAVPGYYAEMSGAPLSGPFWAELADTLRSRLPGAMLVTGANTLRRYPAGAQTPTARRDGLGGYYDHFNTAVGLDSAGRTQLYHKGKLVIGVENTPTWIFDLFGFLTIDLGGTLGQIGRSARAESFVHDGVTVGPAICYEGLYGEYYGGFVRRGAEAMFIISNDGWWGDTPGYRHLFSISRLRAIEHRRAIARSANTGMSGFISPCGEVGATLGWNERGVITSRVPLSREMTFYTRYGDYIGRIAEYVWLLCALYFVAYRVRKRNHLVP